MSFDDMRCLRSPSPSTASSAAPTSEEIAATHSTRDEAHEADDDSTADVQERDILASVTLASQINTKESLSRFPRHLLSSDGSGPIVSLATITALWEIVSKQDQKIQHLRNSHRSIGGALGTAVRSDAGSKAEITSLRETIESLEEKNRILSQFNDNLKEAQVLAQKKLLEEKRETGKWQTHASKLMGKIKDHAQSEIDRIVSAEGRSKSTQTDDQ